MAVTRETQEDIDKNYTPDENRQMADVVLDTYRLTLNLVLEIGASLMRWVLASLLAINGAGALAVMGMPIPASFKLWAAGLFTGGVIASIGAAYMIIRSHPKLTRLIGDAIGYWHSVKIDGERVASMEGHEDRLNDLQNKLSRAPNRLGFASAILFCAAAIVTVVGSVQAL